MSEKQFTKGVTVRTKETQFGEIIKVGIDIEKFLGNEVKNGWINFDIKKSREGKHYAQNN